MELKEREIDIRETGRRCAELERQLPRRERLGTGHATGLPAANANGPGCLVGPQPERGDGADSMAPVLEGEEREALHERKKVW